MTADDVVDQRSLAAALAIRHRGEAELLAEALEEYAAGLRVEHLGGRLGHCTYCGATRPEHFDDCPRRPPAIRDQRKAGVAERAARRVRAAWGL